MLVVIQAPRAHSLFRWCQTCAHDRWLCTSWTRARSAAQTFEMCINRVRPAAMFAHVDPRHGLLKDQRYINPYICICCVNVLVFMHFLHVCMYTCACMYVYMYTYTVCMYMYTFACTCTCTCTRICICKYTYTCTYTYTYTYTYMYTIVYRSIVFW